MVGLSFVILSIARICKAAIHSLQILRYAQNDKKLFNIILLHN